MLSDVVSREVTLLGKPLVAQSTFEWFLTRVQTKVQLEDDFIGETLAADAAGEGSLISVLL